MSTVVPIKVFLQDALLNSTGKEKKLEQNAQRALSLPLYLGFGPALTH